MPMAVFVVMRAFGYTLLVRCCRAVSLIGGAVCLFVAGVVCSEPVTEGETRDTLVVLKQESETHSEFLKGLSTCYLPGQEAGARLRVAGIGELEPEDDLRGVHSIVAVGVEATQSVMAIKAGPPIISAMIPRVTIQHLSPVGRLGPRIHSVFVLDQPLSRHLSLVRSLLPDAKNLGVILGPNTGLYEAELKHEASLRGFSIQSGRVTTRQDLPDVLPGILASSDALLLLYDPVLTAPSGIRFVLYSAYQKRVPVFGYSEGYVKAGALAAVYSKATELGCQVGESLGQSTGFAQGTTTDGGIKVNYPGFFRYKMNHSVARSLSRVTGKLPDGQPMTGEPGSESR